MWLKNELSDLGIEAPEKCAPVKQKMPKGLIPVKFASLFICMNLTERGGVNLAVIDMPQLNNGKNRFNGVKISPQHDLPELPQ